ncbi:DBH-like monooxygenase protein 1 [Chionoecetes opilio]|uniref:DBH-like monooxygenase protein 1 n=1 Tax=Chionoecetes opilio TaxID=41210 RepID=A0A8J4XY02_CHIOP|nr:DBH-like monooxygenase protein 1 [Chionoecetes opilio]
MDACRLHSSVQYRPLDPPANRNDEWDGASLDVFSRHQSPLTRYAMPLTQFHREGLPEDHHTMMVSQRIAVPHTQDTFYWCHIEKIPDWPEKHHYIGDGSDPGDQLEQYVGHPGYECYTPNMPPQFFLCERFLISWAIGTRAKSCKGGVGIRWTQARGSHCCSGAPTMTTGSWRQKEASILAWTLAALLPDCAAPGPRTGWWRVTALPCTRRGTPTRGVKNLHGLSSTATT